MSSGRHLRVRSSRAGAGDHERATTTRRGLAGCVRASWSRAHAGSDTGLGSWGRAEGEGWTGCGCGAGSSNRQQRERRVRFERHKLTLNCLFFCLLGPRTSRTSTRGLSSGVCHLRTLTGADSGQGAPGACHTTRARVGTDLEIVAFLDYPVYRLAGQPRDVGGRRFRPHPSENGPKGLCAHPEWRHQPGTSASNDTEARPPRIAARHTAGLRKGIFFPHTWHTPPPDAPTRSPLDILASRSIESTPKNDVCRFVCFTRPRI